MEPERLLPEVTVRRGSGEQASTGALAQMSFLTVIIELRAHWEQEYDSVLQYYRLILWKGLFYTPLTYLLIILTSLVPALRGWTVDSCSQTLLWCNIQVVYTLDVSLRLWTHSVIDSMRALCRIGQSLTFSTSMFTSPKSFFLLVSAILSTYLWCNWKYFRMKYLYNLT